MVGSWKNPDFKGDFTQEEVDELENLPDGDFDEDAGF